MSKRFGNYLREARIAAGYMSQQAAAQKLSESGRRVSQSLIAQYETNRIVDPDPEILRLMAGLYNKDYLELVLHLIYDKYEIETEQAVSQMAAARLKLWEAGLKRFECIGGVEGLEELQLKAKTRLVASAEILDIEGSAKWQMEFPNLELFWVVAPDFRDDKSPKILHAVIENLKRGVEIIYFIPEKETEKGGRFERLQDKLSTINPKVGLKKVQHQTRAIGLDENALRWLNTDMVIANPNWGADAVGFENFRHNGAATFSIRMSNYNLGDMIGGISRYAATKVKDKKIYLPPSKKYGQLRLLQAAG